MKLFKIALWATIATALSLFFISCDKEDPNDLLGSIRVELKLAEGLSDISLSGIEVQLLNIQDNSERSAITNSEAVALFEALPAGRYNLSVAYSGENDDYTLTANVNSVGVTIQTETPVVMVVDAKSTSAGLVIKEIYYPGADDLYHTLWMDQFIEIFNNSDETLYLDGLYVGSAYTAISKVFPLPYAQLLNTDESVFLDWIFRFPGSGKEHPIEPSQSLLFAFNAIDWRDGSPAPEKSIDLSGADFDIYIVDWLEEKGEWPAPMFDIDNPGVPNVEPIYQVMANFYMIDINSPAIVLFSREEPFSEADIHQLNFVGNNAVNYEEHLMKIPISSVIDGVEIMEDSSMGDLKALNVAIDASFTYLKADGNAQYSGLSLRRKIDEKASARFGRTILQDLNNSSLDFEVLESPDPKGYNK